MAIELRTEELPILAQTATALAQSKLCGHSPQDAYFVLVAGRELGLGPVASLRNIHVIDGKPSLGVHALTAVAMPHCEKWEVESDDKRCRITCKRAKFPGEHTLEYTMEDARRAGLDKRPNWQRLPREMLYARCASNLVRRVFPDIVAGMLSTEEAEDIAPLPVQRVDVTPAYSLDELLASIAATRTQAALDVVASRIKASQPSDADRKTLGRAYQEQARSLSYCTSEDAWRVRLEAAKSAHEAANSYLKRVALFSEAGVAEARLALTCERLRALECVDPEEFVAALMDRRDGK